MIGASNRTSASPIRQIAVCAARRDTDLRPEV